MFEFFDWKYYINKYPDLIQNDINTEDLALQHWINHGYNEGRVCNETNSNNFDWIYYLNLYPDLKDVGINTENKAMSHWLNHGHNEGRICSKIMLESKINNEFDWKYYFNTYPDLKFIDINSEYTVDRIKEHYISKGKKENRVTCYNHLLENYDKNLQILKKDNNIIKELYQQISEIHKDNIINIIIRTSNRPEYFKECIKSILNQTYLNIRIIVSYDNLESLSYLNNYKFEKYYINIESSEKYKFNLYCNILLDKVSDGWIIFLDDDDMFSSDYMLSVINEKLDNENNFIIWKFLRPDRIIYPPDINIIEKGFIANCEYCFHSKFKHLSKWAPIRGGDFNYIDGLLNNNEFNRIFLPYILTQTVYNNKVSSYGENNNNI